MTDHNQPIKHFEFVERTVIECYWLTVALLRWVIHVSIGTVPGLSGFLPEKGWVGGRNWSRGPNCKYLFNCQRPAALVGGFVNERTDGVHVV